MSSIYISVARLSLAASIRSAEMASKLPVIPVCKSISVCDPMSLAPAFPAVMSTVFVPSVWPLASTPWKVIVAVVPAANWVQANCRLSIFIRLPLAASRTTLVITLASDATVRAASPSPEIGAATSSRPM